MNLKKLFFASALLFAACGTIQAQEVIAHRGFWTTDGSAQNSLAALVKADSIHCYGSEFDVWLTTDNQLVVNHDATFKGVTMQSAPAGGTLRRFRAPLSARPYPSHSAGIARSGSRPA